jgi:hypothetical protein
MNEVQGVGSSTLQKLFDNLAALSVEQRLCPRVVTIDHSFWIEAEEVH